ncbi:MAG: pilus assembly PilX N-terminal domain-containing protein [Candidatus Omnitrophica bacterium]|nr:pilus assembly PilX N-terminal domain-containing protein [Candidatus Omnitrophota bacterium]
MKNKGVALIAVIVMIVLFSSIILTVVLSATISLRRANYYKDKLIALEIAEAGIQHWLYKINYEKYDTGCYPWGEGQTVTNPETAIEYYVGGKKGECKLKIDPDNTGEDTKILAVGSYKGRQVKISFEIRSETELKRGDKLNEGLSVETQGIPEAFNKHLIYANSVQFGNGISGKGNIFAFSITGSGSSFTKTIASNIQVPVLNTNYKPANPYDLKYSGPYDRIFKDTDLDGQVEVPGGNYTRTSSTEIYTLSSSNIDQKWKFEKTDPSYSLLVNIRGNTTLNNNGIVYSEQNINLDFSNPNNPNIQGMLVAEEDITIEYVGVSNPNPIGKENQTTLWAGRNITINYNSIGPQIKGDIVGIDKIEIKGNTAKNIKGSLMSRNEIYIDGGTLTIDSTNSQTRSSLLLFNDSNTTLKLTISSPVNITLGENQIAGIMIFFDNVVPGGSGKKSNILISNEIKINPALYKFLIFNQSESSENFILSGGNLIGSIYSVFYQNTSQEINLNTNLNGLIITNGKVNLGNNIQINYDPENFKKIDFKGVFKFFVGGRRRYLPLLGSWRIEW